MLPCSAFAWLVGLLLISAVFRGAVHSMYRPHFTQHPGSPAVSHAQLPVRHEGVMMIGSS